MADSQNDIDDLKRLQIALEGLSADLDTIERRPHYALQFAAEKLTTERSRGIEEAVSNFAVAMSGKRRIEALSHPVEIPITARGGKIKDAVKSGTDA